MVFDSLDCKVRSNAFAHTPLFSEQYGTEIEATDVLCGRGKTSFNHIGNRRFRDIIANSVEDYHTAKSRLEKSMVVHRIVEQVKKVKGRFLKQDRFSGRWYELDERQAKEKVGHAIRDATSSVDPKKKILKKSRSKGTTSPTSSMTKKMPPRSVSASSTCSNASSAMTVKSDNTSDPWEDMEPLHVDSLEAQNSLEALENDDLFLTLTQSFLGQTAAEEDESGFYAPFRLEIM